MAHAGGRPTKYDPKVIPIVLECMAQGWSLAEVAAELHVAKSTMWEWRENHKEFSKALEEGIDLSESWWTKKSREELYNKDFNDRLWYRNMANRFGWRDKVDTNLNATVSHAEALKGLDK